MSRHELARTILQLAGVISVGEAGTEDPAFSVSCVTTSSGYVFAHFQKRDSASICPCWLSAVFAGATRREHE
jgi:hypothetical protein